MRRCQAPHSGPCAAAASAVLTLIEAQAARATAAALPSNAGRCLSRTVRICCMKSAESRLPVVVSEPA